MKTSLNKILIAEDDVFISEHLKQILINLGYSVCGIVSSFEMLQTTIDKNDLPDLALLDIRMHNEDQGIKIAEYFRKLKVPFIFITSFSDKKTLEVAVAQQPLGYIVKPFTPEEIKTTVEQVFTKLTPTFLLIKDKGLNKKLYFNTIKFVKSDNNYIEFHTTDKVYIERLKLSDVEDLLPKNLFVRVHRSFLINKKHVDSFKNNIIYIGQIEIPVSRKYKFDFNTSLD